jgi:hemerythrin-like domain-containing protein
LNFLSLSATLQALDKGVEIMSQAIDDLKHEHDVILMALKILDGMCRKIESGQIVDSPDPQSFIDFLKEFADKCHHGKEEGILFPAIVAAGIAQEGGPVGVMLQEHIEGRRFIHEMQSSLYPKLSTSAFIHAAKGYTELLQSHIEKENNVLFPMAEKILKPTQLDALFKAFEEHEEKVIGSGRHEQLHDLLKQMKAKYLN